MRRNEPKQITELLAEVRTSGRDASDALLPMVYDELHQLAAHLFAQERRGHTLQPTALVHEAWVKLVGNIENIEDRRHFFVIASRAMRQVLTDHARRAQRQKRGEGRKRVTLETTYSSGRTGQAGQAGTVDLVDLDDTLRRLAELNARHAEVVELRILGGLTIQESADALGVSHTTVENDWFMAKAWLRRALNSA